MKTQHLPPIPPAMQDASQLLSLLNTSNTIFIVWENSEMEAICNNCQTDFQNAKKKTSYQVSYQPLQSEWSHAPNTLYSIKLDWILMFMSICMYYLLTSPELMKSQILIFKYLENLSFVPASLGSIYMLWWNWLWDSIPLVSTKATKKRKMQYRFH